MQRAHTRRDGDLITDIHITASTDNVDLEQVILNEGYPVDIDKMYRVIVDPGVCIGSTASATPSITTGDLTGWLRVALEIDPSSLGVGRGGSGGAAATGTGNDGQDGGTALQIVNGSVLYMTLESQARCFGGGGGAGSGGGGGTGQTIIYEAWRDAFTIPRYRWDQVLGQGSGQVTWNDANMGNFTGMPPDEGTYPIVKFGIYTYQRNSTTRFEDRFWNIRRGTTSVGNPGDGGFGGRGAGPCVEGATVGNGGGIGTYGAGNGGAGGTGGELGQSGGNGTDGTSGNIGSGALSGSGGQPGLDIEIINGSIVVDPQPFYADTGQKTADLTNFTADKSYG